MYEEGSIILNNRIKVSCESKNRVQIEYTEFERRSIVKDDYIVHQPSWLIVPTTYSNDVWVRGSVVCYFTNVKNRVPIHLLDNSNATIQLKEHIQELCIVHKQN